MTPPSPPPPRDTSICGRTPSTSAIKGSHWGSEVAQPSSHQHRPAGTSKVFLHPVSAGTSGRAATKPGGATASHRRPMVRQLLLVAFMMRPERESLIWRLRPSLRSRSRSLDVQQASLSVCLVSFFKGFTPQFHHT